MAAGQSCKPPEPALEASPLTTLGDIASAMCKFSLAKQRYVCLCLVHSKPDAGTENLMHAHSASIGALLGHLSIIPPGTTLPDLGMICLLIPTKCTDRQINVDDMLDMFSITHV